MPTPYVEANALLAALDADLPKLNELVSSLLPGERHALRLAVERLSTALRTANDPVKATHA